MNFYVDMTVEMSHISYRISQRSAVLGDIIT